MKNKEILDKLQKLGFREYESRVFLALLKGKPMSASDIAKESKVIRNSIYDILKSFVEKGYCNEIETNHILQYQIIDPSIIFDKLEADYQKNYNSKLTDLRDAYNEVRTVYDNQKSPDVNDNINVELIRGFNKHRVSKYMELYKNAKEQVLGMYRLKGLVSQEFDDIAAGFIKRGGKIRSLYQASLDFKIVLKNKTIDATESDFIETMERFREAGEELKISRIKIPNVTIFDNEIVFINLTDKKLPKNKQADIIIRNKEYAEHMTDLFEFYWNSALSINQFKSEMMKKVS